MNKVIIYTSTVVILLIIFLLLLFHRQKNEADIETARLELGIYKQYANYRKYSIFDELSSNLENLQIAEIVKPQIPLGIKELQTLNRNEPLLVYRMSEMHCDECINSTIKVLKKIISRKKWLKDRLIILVSTNSIRNLRIWMEKDNIEFKTYVVISNDLKLKSESLNMPYLFMLLPDKKVSSVYIPQKEIEKFTEDYINSIIERFYNKI